LLRNKNTIWPKFDLVRNSARVQHNSPQAEPNVIVKLKCILFKYNIKCTELLGPEASTTVGFIL
jgi:hypothetical protein